MFGELLGYCHKSLLGLGVYQCIYIVSTCEFLVKLCDIDGTVMPKNNQFFSTFINSLSVPAFL
jgi:hypothetical protein